MEPEITAQIVLFSVISDTDSACSTNSALLPLHSLKSGAQTHLGPRCFYWDKDSTPPGRASAAVFKRAIACVCHRYSPQTKLALKQGQG